jgi:hypothetical protein
MLDQTDNSAFDSGQKLAAVGGVIGALAASSCCILPVILFSLGIGGAWIGNFTQLAPYQPYFIAAPLAFIGAGYWLVYRFKNRLRCGRSLRWAVIQPARQNSAHCRNGHRHSRLGVRLRRTLRAVITNAASK